MAKKDSKKEKAQAQARLAVAEFRKMVPMLTGYARALTGNQKLIVREGSSTVTTGDTIYIRPPMALGKKGDHKRQLCGTRDEHTLRQLCDKCHTRDQVMAYLYHEMAHINYGSFDLSKPRDLERVTLTALQDCDDPTFAEYVVYKINKTTDRSTWDDTQKWARAINPFMMYLLLVLEDFRVDSESFRIRPGIRVSRMADHIELLSQGFEYEDGEVHFLYDTPLNMQMSLAMNLYLHGHNMKDKVSPEVIEALGDERLNEILDDLHVAKSASDVYRVCLLALARLRQLGYFVTEEEPKPEPEPDKGEYEGENDGGGQPGEQGDGAPMPGAGDSAPGSDDDTPLPDMGDGQEQPQEGGDDDTSDDDGDREGDDTKSGGDQDGDESEAGEGGDEIDDTPTPDMGDTPEQGGYSQEDLEKIAKALQKILGHELGEQLAGEGVTGEIVALMEKLSHQAVHFDNESSEVLRVREFKAGEGDAWDNKYGGPTDEIKVPEQAVGRSVLEARRAFTDNQMSKMLRHRKSGKVNGAALGKRAWNSDERLFQKKILPGKKDYEVLIGLDVSGSTDGDVLQQIKRSAAALAEVCNRSGVKFSIYAHSAESFNEDGTVGWAYHKTVVGMTLDMYQIKASESPWDKKARRHLETLQCCAGNIDGHTLEYYRKRMDESRATKKIIMYFTDGLMPASNVPEETEILKREILECKKKGYTLLGVGIGTESPKKHGLDTVRVDQDEDIYKVVRHLTKELTA